ncbi:hypothetical protein J3L16_07505 [Alteromonas sp. 5E99-2]|uniref:hypothetical protein n=1 Tax=Alteromonas sp. 5E99-2 TaxID=2817683 RepID=UPI001A993136|nr:hypothetical protein [Alteromonas sp. 5E99-2]MBO1255526.1 hypothetical protein [Alteromonas sp. 5E99-2]
MTKLDKDEVIQAFSNAYSKANGKTPEITAKGGWYSVDGGKNIRLAQLQEMTDNLSSASPSAEKPKKSKKPAKTKKVKTASFSVKDFWENKIMDNNKGAIKPR